MLFNEKILFIHVPKAAGTSITGFLIRTLPGRITMTEPSRPLSSAGAPPAARLGLALRRIRHEVSVRLRPRLRRIAGTRHENLAQASEVLARCGRKLGDFEAIVAVIRNPYDLEVSRFHYLRRGHLGLPGIAGTLTEKLALAGDFAAFAARAPYHGQLPARMEEWFEIDGHIPPNLCILRFESLEQELCAALAPFCRRFSSLPHLNASKHGPHTQYLSREIEEAIYRKYRWLFDRGFYPRELDPEQTHRNRFDAP